jgi:formylglycine-generating enzyme required for sulfatase activity
MVLVRGEPFRMGHDSVGTEDNRPAHEVKLSPFYIDVYPVTNRRFADYVQKTGVTSEGNWWRYHREGENDDHPVRGVTYGDCERYCKELGKRLPTEAEWEFAAKGEVGYLYPWGDDFRPGLAHCGHPPSSEPFAVGMYEPNPLGLYDTAGNVAEWVKDWYAKEVYARRKQRGTVEDPCTDVGTERVVRGGHWASGPAEVSSVARARHPPRASLPHVGFRTAWPPRGG